MTRCAYRMLVGVTLTLVLAGCAGSLMLETREEMRVGDRLRDWSLVYYQSWLRSQNPRYLRLSREHLTSAITTYFELQVRIGHVIPDFYRIDRRRVRSCRFLSEIDRAAARMRLALEDSRHGCLD